MVHRAVIVVLAFETVDDEDGLIEDLRVWGDLSCPRYSVCPPVHQLTYPQKLLDNLLNDIVTSLGRQ